MDIELGQQTNGLQTEQKQEEDVISVVDLAVPT